MGFGRGSDKQEFWRFTIQCAIKRLPCRSHFRTSRSTNYVSCTSWGYFLGYCSTKNRLSTSKFKAIVKHITAHLTMSRVYRNVDPQSFSTLQLHWEWPKLIGTHYVSKIFYKHLLSFAVGACDTLRVQCHRVVKHKNLPLKNTLCLMNYTNQNIV